MYIISDVYFRSSMLSQSRGLGCFIGLEEVGNEIFIANTQSPQTKHAFKPAQLMVCVQVAINEMTSAKKSKKNSEKHLVKRLQSGEMWFQPMQKLCSKGQFASVLQRIL